MKEEVMPYLKNYRNPYFLYNNTISLRQKVKLKWGKRKSDNFDLLCY